LINERTLALVPTHHWGGVVDMDGVMDVARRHGLKVVEDCAQSPGASFHGRPVGSIGDAGCFSIACYKIIGGGEGGLLTTNDEAIFSRAMQLAECGGFWRPDRFAPQRYEGELFVGTNYRMSELEAAVDIVQLRKLPGIVSRYRSVFRRVTERLQRRRGIVPQKLNDPEGTIGYMLRFFPETHELAAKIAAELNAAGITAEHRGRDAHPDWHLYRDMFPVASCDGSPTTPGRCPVAEDLFDRGIIVHLDQWWSPEDANAAGDVIDHVLGRHCDASADAPAWM
jgi:dTDP-4-amino-4,6-dideoxygalactose transaminase